MPSGARIYSGVVGDRLKTSVAPRVAVPPFTMAANFWTTEPSAVRTLGGMFTAADAFSRCTFYISGGKAGMASTNNANSNGSPAVPATPYRLGVENRIVGWVFNPAFNPKVWLNGFDNYGSGAGPGGTFGAMATVAIGGIETTVQSENWLGGNGWFAIWDGLIPQLEVKKLLDPTVWVQDVWPQGLLHLWVMRGSSVEPDVAGRFSMNVTGTTFDQNYRTHENRLLLPGIARIMPARPELIQVRGALPGFMARPRLAQMRRALSTFSGRKLAFRISVGDTTQLVETPILPGKHVVVLENTGTQLGIEIDDAAQVTQAIVGTPNAQSGALVIGAKIVDGVKQSNPVARALAYASVYDLTVSRPAERGRAADILAPVIVGAPHFSVTYGVTTLLDLSPYVQDPSGLGWSVVNVVSADPTATVITDTDPHKISVTPVVNGVNSQFAIGLTNAMPGALIRTATLFGSALSGAALYANGRAYRREISLNNEIFADLTDDVTNFVLPVVMSATWLRSVANGGRIASASGFDVQFTSSTLAIYKHKLKYYDPVNGVCVFNVLMPTVRFSQPTGLYVYYGDTTVSADQSNGTSVYIDYEFAIDLYTGLDMSGKGRDAVRTGSGFTNQAGNVRNEVAVAGAGYWTIPDASFLNGKSAIVFDFMYRPSTLGVDKGMVVGGSSITGDDTVNISCRNDTQLVLSGGGEGIKLALRTTVAHLIFESISNVADLLKNIVSFGWSATSQALQLRKNGDLVTQANPQVLAGGTLVMNGPLSLGRGATQPAAGNFVGLFEEWRCAARGPSNNRGTLDARALLDPTTFISIGREETPDDIIRLTTLPIDVSLPQEVTTDIDVLAKASGTGGTRSISGTPTCDHGTCSVVSGLIRVVPTVGYSGQALITYVVTDGTRTVTGYVRLNITKVAVPSVDFPEAWNFRRPIPWLPALDANIVVVNVPSTGITIAPETGSPSQVLLLVPPLGKLNGRIKFLNTRYGAVLGYGWDFLFNLGDLYHTATSTETLVANVFEGTFSNQVTRTQRPYVHFCNGRFDTQCKGGDMFRIATAANVAQDNFADGCQIFIGNWYGVNGHYSWTDPTLTAPGNQGPHSDVVQFNGGPVQSMYMFNFDMPWMGQFGFVRASDQMSGVDGPDGEMVFEYVHQRIMPADAVTMGGNGQKSGGLFFVADRSPEGRGTVYTPKKLTECYTDFAPAYLDPTLYIYSGSGGSNALVPAKVQTPDTIGFVDYDFGGRGLWCKGVVKIPPIINGVRQATITPTVMICDQAYVGNKWRVTSAAQLRQVRDKTASEPAEADPTVPFIGVPGYVLETQFTFGTDASNNIRNLTDLALYFNPYPYWGSGTHINNELQTFQELTAGYHVFESDCLVLKALPAPGAVGPNYTTIGSVYSAAICSKINFGPDVIIEVKAKMPAGNVSPGPGAGMWTSIWTYQNTGVVVGTEEIDLNETQNNGSDTRLVLYQNIHGPSLTLIDNFTHSPIDGSWHHLEDMSADYHVYSARWESNNDVTRLYDKLPGAKTRMNGYTFPPKTKPSLFIFLSVGSTTNTWPGPVTDASFTGGGNEFRISEIKIWRKTAPDPTGVVTQTVVAAGADNGWLKCFNAAYATARSGAGTIVVQTGDHWVGQKFETGLYEVQEVLLDFDTSSLPSDKDVIDAYLQINHIAVYGSPGSIEVRAVDFGATIAAGDWIPMDSLAAIPVIAIVGQPALAAAGSFSKFGSSAAFAAAINRSGSTRLMLVSDKARRGLTPTTSDLINFRNLTTPGSEPRLVLTLADNGTVVVPPPPTPAGKVPWAGTAVGPGGAAGNTCANYKFGSQADQVFKVMYTGDLEAVGFELASNKIGTENNETQKSNDFNTGPSSWHGYVTLHKNVAGGFTAGAQIGGRQNFLYDGQHGNNPRQGLISCLRDASGARSRLRVTEGDVIHCIVHNNEPGGIFSVNYNTCGACGAPTPSRAAGFYFGPNLFCNRGQIGYWGEILLVYADGTVIGTPNRGGNNSAGGTTRVEIGGVYRIRQKWLAEFNTAATKLRMWLWYRLGGVPSAPLDCQIWEATSLNGVYSLIGTAQFTTSNVRGWNESTQVLRQDNPGAGWVDWCETTLSPSTINIVKGRYYQILFRSNSATNRWKTYFQEKLVDQAWDSVVSDHLIVKTFNKNVNQIAGYADYSKTSGDQTSGDTSWDDFLTFGSRKTRHNIPFDLFGVTTL